MRTLFESAIRSRFGAWALACAFLAGCGGGGGGDSSPPATAPVSQNRAPLPTVTLAGLLVSGNGAADAGTFTGSEVKFDAGNSTDPDGDTLSFAWTLVSKPNGSSMTVQGSTPQLLIKPDVAGTYVVSVRISDGKGAAIDKQASIVVSANSAPLTSVAVSATYSAVPSVAQTTRVTVGATLVFDGSGTYDADDNLLNTAWDVLERPAGSRAALASDGKTMRLNTDVAGTYKVRARATDQLGAYSEAVYPFEAVGTAPTVVSVVSVNNGPVEAGSTQIDGTIGYRISLSGAGSSNPDGVALAHAWTLVAKPAASSVALDSANGVYSQFTPDVLGDYVVRLVVTAPSGIASSYTTTVSVKNRRPLAAIGTNAVPVSLPSGPTLRLPANTTVTLRGTGSSDADGDAIAYAWTLQSKPEGSAATLSAANLSTVQLTTDRSGSYVVLLRVSDTAGAYSEQTLVIASGNAAPVAVLDKSRLSVLAGSAASIDAGFSFDDDGDTLSYSWALDAKPAASAATIGSSAAALAFTPDVEGTYVASVTVSDGKTSSIAYVTIRALSSTVTTTTLPFKPLITRYSRGLDRVVAVSAAPNLLSIVDPFSGALRQVPLPATVKSMALSPDGKLAAVLHENAVTLVDIDKATLLGSSASNGTHSEVFVTNAALIYMIHQSSGEGVVVVNGRTGENVTAAYSKLPAYSYYGYNARGLYSSVNRRAYFVGDSAYDLSYFSLDANGVVTALSRPFYNYNYQLGAPLFLSANEDLIFTRAGTYFRADTLAYVGSLGVNGIVSLSHSASAGEVIAMTATQEYDYTANRYIDRYQQSYKRYTGTLLFPEAAIDLPLVAGSQSYGIAVFHGGNDKHVAVVQTGDAASTAAGLKYYVVVTR